jgi:hypothetical protein
MSNATPLWVPLNVAANDRLRLHHHKYRSGVAQFRRIQDTMFFLASFAYTLPAAPFLNLTRRGPHDMDRVADHISGTLFAFAASSYRAPLT